MGMEKFCHCPRALQKSLHPSPLGTQLAVIAVWLQCCPSISQSFPEVSSTPGFMTAATDIFSGLVQGYTWVVWSNSRVLSLCGKVSRSAMFLSFKHIITRRSRRTLFCRHLGTLGPNIWSAVDPQCIQPASKGHCEDDCNEIVKYYVGYVWYINR